MTKGQRFFDLDEVHYANDIEKDGWKVRFLKDRIGKKMMAVFLDIVLGRQSETNSNGT